MHGKYAKTGPVPISPIFPLFFRFVYYGALLIGISNFAFNTTAQANNTEADCVQMAEEGLIDYLLAEDPLGYGHQEYQNQIISCGDKLFSYYLSVLQNTEDDRIIINLMGIISLTKGDHSTFISVMKNKLLKSDKGYIREAGLRALGIIGSVDDCPVLLEHFKKELDVGVGYKALLGMVNLCDESTALEIESIIKERETTATNDTDKTTLEFQRRGLRDLRRRILTDKMKKEKDNKKKKQLRDEIHDLIKDEIASEQYSERKSRLEQELSDLDAEEVQGNNEDKEDTTK